MTCSSNALHVTVSCSITSMVNNAITSFNLSLNTLSLCRDGFVGSLERIKNRLFLGLQRSF